MNRAWAIGVASAGLLFVGVTYGCIWYAVPDRPIARDWPAYGPILLGPYLLAAIGCGRSIDRALGAVVVAAGLLLTGFVADDVRPTFSGKPAPAMPTSGFVAGMVLMVQYPAGLSAALGALTARRTGHRPRRGAETL